MPENLSIAGLGDPKATFKVYIANSPNVLHYPDLSTVVPVTKGEVHAIGQDCGNGWRKVFNVYAKLLFALNMENRVALHGAPSWQHYRDNYLLQAGSNTSLLFTPPSLDYMPSDASTVNNIHIVMGKTYAKSLHMPAQLDWLDNEFAIDQHAKLIVCPYFDYRQLSNLKIIRLVELIKQLLLQPTS